MELIRTTPGKIYAKSNTHHTIKLLVFIACLLVVLVCGICAFAIFWRVPLSGSHLHSSGKFYYALKGNAVRLESFVDNTATEYAIPAVITHAGSEYKVTEIGANAFTNNERLQKIVIPDTVTKIAGADKTGAFSGCINLREIVWGNGVSNIGPYAFKNCLALTTLVIPQNIQIIDRNAFMNCTGLNTLQIYSNVLLDKTSFTNCQGITRLELGAMVGLDLKREAFAALGNLTTFTVAPANTTYQAVDNCLLSQDGNTLYLGGKGATIPARVTRLADFAFGNRYERVDINLPATVTAVAPHAFADGIIFTDLTTKPDGWQTSLTVCYGAKKANFYRKRDAADTVMVPWYTYEADGTVYPDYVDLFGATDAAQQFWRWESQADGYYATYVNKAGLREELAGCESIAQSNGEDYEAESFGAFQTKYVAALAVYQDATAAQGTIDTALADLQTARANLTRVATDFSELDSDLESARLLLNNAEKRLKYKLPVWEEFKAAYGAAEMTRHHEQSTRAEIEQARRDLVTQYARLVDDNPDILESTDWRIGLKNLVTSVTLLLLDLDAAASNGDRVDFSAGVDSLKSSYYKATLAMNDENTTDVKGREVWLNLREAYENLTVDPQNLNEELAQCTDLREDDYTTASWQEFAACLQRARQITTYNISITTVRKALAAARAALVPDPGKVAELHSLVTKYQNLPASDYEGNWQRWQNALAAATAEPIANTDLGNILRELKASRAALQAKPADLISLQVWISICENLDSALFTAASYRFLTTTLTAAQNVDATGTISQVEKARLELQGAHDRLVRVPEPEHKVNVFTSISTAAYFTVAAILFTGAIATLSVAFSLHKSRRSKFPE